MSKKSPAALSFSDSPEPSSNLHLNAKGYAMVAAMIRDHGIAPLDAVDVPHKVTWLPWTMTFEEIHAYDAARTLVESMTPAETRRLTRLGKSLTADIVRVPVPGKEWAFLR